METIETISNQVKLLCREV